MIEMPQLPYAKSSLEPHVSADTLGLHHGRHVKAYVDRTNELIAGTSLEKAPLVEIVRETAGDEKHKTLFNNAAQVWNHDFYFHSMAPKGGGEPAGALKDRIERDFGGFGAFRDLFRRTGVEHFGSGYVWLVAANSKLAIEAKPNAETPIVGPNVPLLCADLWEHAYYVDYQNKRPEYLDAFLDSLLNWTFVEKNLAAA